MSPAGFAAAGIKQVPGRKTDVADCAWIAQLLEHGLLRGSFVPPAPIREFRATSPATARPRFRTGRERPIACRKILEDANIKLSSVATDILGVSGRAMLNALVTGTTDPKLLADLARVVLRKKLPALRQALTGRFRQHHAFLVGQILAHLDYLEESIAETSRRIEEQLRPFAEALERLITIPGVQRRTAEVILAEIGTDMTRFADSAQLGELGRNVSWQPRKRWQTEKRQNPQGQQMAARRFDRVWQRRRPYQVHRTRRALSTPGAPSRPPQGGGRDRPSDSRNQL